MAGHRRRLVSLGADAQRVAAPATEMMLDMAGIRVGSRVLDVAAGAGNRLSELHGGLGQAATVSATNIAPNIFARGAEDAVRQAGPDECGRANDGRWETLKGARRVRCRDLAGLA